MNLKSYVLDAWYEAPSGFVDVSSAIDGRPVARVSSAGVDFAAVVLHARETGGPNLRALTFHERGALIKALATHLASKKDAFYAVSYDTGSTAKDHLTDIDGGIGTLFSYASKARREFPDGHIVLDGPQESASKNGTFVGRHIRSPRRGVAVHINAFNFPCWGMLEKLAPALIAGVPAIVKPATATAYVTVRVFEEIVASGILPPGAVQLIAGSIGDTFEHLNGQDVVSFTGSLHTSLSLQAHPAIARNAVRFIAERDSLNAAVLGPDAVEGTPEFDLFVREVVREMTVKAGQKCTAIRRALVPRASYEAAGAAIAARLGKVVVGDPRAEGTTMGPVVSLAQRDDVRQRVCELLQDETIVLFGGTEHGPSGGAYLAPVLLGCAQPLQAKAVHEVEAFGPVATLMPYDTLADAVDLVCRAEGSLVASVYTYDDVAADAIVAGIAPYHGRILVLDRDCARESTGHGAPLPMFVHGGPGRAGGGEELGGVRAVYHYLQRTALQGSPERLARITGAWARGAFESSRPAHPFRYAFDELAIGQTIHTASRTITLDDIEHFAHFTGDTFYAHMDDDAAKANPFFPGRVAHGYLLLSFAAGLFVDAAPGPVLANTGLDNLRFSKPVSPGDAIAVRLTVAQKTPRNAEYGEVRWDVELTNQHGETVATYELLTMNAVAASARLGVG